MLINRKVVGTVSPLFGLPAVLAEFAWSYAEFCTFNSQYVCGPDQMIHYIRPHHAYLPIARNEIVKQAVGEWTLMLDTDHQVPADLLFRLINAMRRYDAEVVTALYLHRRSLPAPVLWKFGDNDEPLALAGWPKNEVMEIDCAGAGALLVKNSVFDRIHTELKEEPFSTQEYKQTIGEDFAFFRRLKKLGIRSICPTYIECPHLQVRPLRLGVDYDPDDPGLETLDIKAQKRVAV